MGKKKLISIDRKDDEMLTGVIKDIIIKNTPSMKRQIITRAMIINILIEYVIKNN